MPSSMIGTIVWSRYVRIGKFQTAESRAAAPGGSVAGGPGSGALGLGSAGLGAGGAAGGGAGGAAGAVVAGGASMSLQRAYRDIGQVGASGGGGSLRRPLVNGGRRPAMSCCTLEESGA